MSSPGQFEHQKFSKEREEFGPAMEQILNLGHDPSDYIHYFPAFTGTLTIARFLSLYELYQQTLGVVGHIAEVGVFKGAASMFFAKLTKIYEPFSLTQVHGFDWFKGAQTTSEEKYVEDGECQEDYPRVIELIKLQQLDNILHIHNLDVTQELKKFFDEHTHLQFKLIFLDCGIYDVVKESIEEFWPRLTPGGIMVFDQFNHEFAAGETRAIKERLPDAQIKTLPHGWMPTAYIVK